jgi:DNA ligase D-like protein (predicted ligase)
MHVKDPEQAKETGIPVYYYVFDILYLEGCDTTALALRTRKALLKRAFSFPDPIRFLTHRNAEGEAYLKGACKKGWEGVIAKDAHSKYVHGRSTRWLKFKCVNQQEFVIGGFTDPHGERTGFGALLVGYYENDSLVYAGKVGTGYDEETLKRLRERFSSLVRKTSPFDTDVNEKEVHWVSPKLVAEIGFTEWTSDHRLRHPRFLGLRRDKDPTEVVREEAKT